MENLTHALYMAFAMVVFVIAFSVSLYLVNKLNTTAKDLVYRIDGSYYDSLSLNKMIENNEDRNRSRIVGIDTIIPTLYRYYKESFAVKILDVDGKLLQYFDVTTERDVNAAANNQRTEISSIPDPKEQKIVQATYDKYDALLSLYGANAYCYMFEAPWLSETFTDAKTRIDMYINGGKGYIKDTLVDYSQNLGPTGDKRPVALKNYKDRKFKEVFAQYAYEGDTISDDSTGELVTLTGSKQISTKIIITYQVLPE